MADPEVGWFERPGGAAMRYAHWPAVGGPMVGTPTVRRPAGLLVLLNGRTEYIEKYVETAGFWTERGLAVYSLDWRGQGLSARQTDNGSGHIDHYDTYIGDLTAWLDTVVYPAAEGAGTVLLAHSMGGHIGLRYLASADHRIAAAAFCAPMIDIDFPWSLSRLGSSLLAAILTRLGQGRAFRWGGGPARPEGERFEGNLVTTDPVRWQVQRDAFLARPELRVGDLSWGWIDASLRSIRALQGPGMLERITIPVLIGSGGADKVVSNAAHRRAAARIPACRHRVYEGARHEIMMERDRYRDRFLADVAAHFDQVIGSAG